MHAWLKSYDVTTPSLEKCWFSSTLWFKTSQQFTYVSNLFSFSFFLYLVAKCHLSRYHFAHHFAPHNLTVSARDRGNGMWKWVWSIEVQRRRLHTFSSATEAGDTQRQGGRAMLKDILPCPFGLGLEIDIFQSDEALMWVIQLFHHCDMRLLANAHPCWWAHPTPQGLWLTYPPSSFPSLSASLCHLCSFISIALLPCFLSPCHVQSLFGWPGTQSGRQGAGSPR